MYVSVFVYDVCLLLCVTWISRKLTYMLPMRVSKTQLIHALIYYHKSRVNKENKMLYLCVYTSMYRVAPSNNGHVVPSNNETEVYVHMYQLYQGEEMYI